MVDIILDGPQQNVFPNVEKRDCRRIAEMMKYQGNCRGFIDADNFHLFDSYGFTHTSYANRMKVDTSRMDSLILMNNGTIVLADHYGDNKYSPDDLWSDEQIDLIKKIYAEIGIDYEDIEVIDNI